MEVSPADILNVTVGQAADKIAGFIQPCRFIALLLRVALEGVGDKGALGLLRIIQITPGQANATDIKLTDHTDGDRCQVFI
ncbi:hypothetical protein D3C76_1398730 [compost metagenome]